MWRRQHRPQRAAGRTNSTLVCDRAARRSLLTRSSAASSTATGLSTSQPSRGSARNEGQLAWGQLPPGPTHLGSAGGSVATIPPPRKLLLCTGGGLSAAATGCACGTRTERSSSLSPPTAVAAATAAAPGPLVAELPVAPTDAPPAGSTARLPPCRSSSSAGSISDHGPAAAAAATAGALAASGAGGCAPELGPGPAPGPGTAPTAIASSWAAARCACCSCWCSRLTSSRWVIIASRRKVAFCCSARGS